MKVGYQIGDLVYMDCDNEPIYYLITEIIRKTVDEDIYDCYIISHNGISFQVYDDEISHAY